MTKKKDRYVYLLSEYNQRGSEKVIATLNRESLVDLLNKNWHGDSGELREWRERALAGLLRLLEKSDVELAADSGYDCVDGDGWVEMQLHVVRLV